MRRERGAWLLVAAGLLWAIGDLYWSFKLSKLEEIPYPSLADLFYLAGYPALYAGIALLTRTRLQTFERSVWLDGLIGALAVAAVGAAFLYPAFEGSTEGASPTVVVNLAYPLGDLMLLSFLVAAVALRGWHADRGWALLAGGLAVMAIADGVYLQQEATVATGRDPGPTRSGSWAPSRLPGPPGRRAADPSRSAVRAPPARAAGAVRVRRSQSWSTTTSPGSRSWRSGWRPRRSRSSSSGWL